jgi:hypothetical protein
MGMVLCLSPADESSNVKQLKDEVMQGVCYENAMVFTYYLSQTVYVEECLE